MAGRFLGPIGKELTGPNDKTAPLMALARTMAGAALDLIGTGKRGSQHLRKVLDDGSTIHVFVARHILGAAPLVRAWVEVAQRGGQRPLTVEIVIAAVWRPEGLMLTPRSASAPFGYGAPRREQATGARVNPPFGTAIADADAEALNQVLLNRFAHNRYFDTPAALSAVTPAHPWPENEALRATAATGHHNGFGQYWPWTWFYEPLTEPFWDEQQQVWVDFWDAHRQAWIDLPGVNRLQDGVWYPLTTGDRDRQDAERRPVWEEPEAATWHCHWPEETLYPNAAYEQIFQRTNALRQAHDERPVIRPLRGRPSPARLIVAEMQRASALFHDIDLYRPGYRTIAERVQTLIPSAVASGENLQISDAAGLTAAAGDGAFEHWEASPAHLGNILHEIWSRDRQVTSLDVAGGVAMTATATGIDGYVIPDGGLTGTAWAQMFHANRQWLSGGSWNNETPYGRVGVRGTRSFLHADAQTTGDPYDAVSITHMGNLLPLSQFADYCNVRYLQAPSLEGQGTQRAIKPRVLGATIFADAAGRLHYRAVTTLIAPTGFAGSENLDSDGYAVRRRRVQIWEAPLLGGGHGNWDLVHDRWASDFEPAFLQARDVPEHWNDVAHHVTAVSFTTDGTQGIFTLVTRTEDYEIFVDGEFVDAAPYVFHTDLAVTADGFAVVRQYAPPTATVPLTGTGMVDGSWSMQEQATLYPHYVDDELRYLTYSVAAAYDKASGVANVPGSFTVNLTVGERTLALAASPPSATTLVAGFVTFPLYLDPRTGDHVLLRVNFATYAAAPTTRGSIDLIVNGDTVKSYPSVARLTENGTTCGYFGPMPFFKYRMDCGVPVRLLQQLFMLVDIPACSYFTYGSGIDACTPTKWPDAEGGPLRLHALCEFARYQDRYIAEIVFADYVNICSGVAPYDRVIHANFDVDAAVGIGALTSVMPLGVV